jgi:hypothetical protein
MEAAAAPMGWTRETRIRRDPSGRWFDGDTPIDHPSVARAFDRWIERAEDGRYRLRNEVNWAYVQIEGAPIFVRALSVGPTSVSLQLSDGRQEALDPTTLRQGPDGVLYCTVRSGTLPARFDAHAAVQLAPAVDEDEHGLYVALTGLRHRVPVVDDPLG